jgi:hypothetical protein
LLSRIYRQDAKDAKEPQTAEDAKDALWSAEEIIRKRGEEFFWDYPLRFPVEFPGIHSGDHVIVWLATLTTLLGRGED